MLKRFMESFSFFFKITNTFFLIIGGFCNLLSSINIRTLPSSSRFNLHFFWVFFLLLLLF